MLAKSACCVFVSFAISIMLCKSTSAQFLNPPAEIYEDAQLNHVEFVDSRTGWAVGSHGLLLQTKDAGRSWRIVKTPVNCNLQSIAFRDINHGWAIGGYYVPHLKRSVGVILETTDGGANWETVQNNFPFLRYIKAGSQGATIVGDSNFSFPGGCFFSVGKQGAWDPATTLPFHYGWRSVAMTKSSMIGVGNDGSVRFINQLSESYRASLKSNAIIESVAADGESVCCVGRNGEIFVSANAGKNWVSAFKDAQFQFQSVAIRGTKIWAVGSPGSIVLHSNDFGETWQRQQTKENAGLKCITFVDDKSGWAVGHYGLILHTRDGGKSWETQRGDQRRAGVLALLSPDELPLELFSHIAAAKGRYVSTLILNSDRKSIDLEELALTRVGCNSVGTLTTVEKFLSGDANQIDLSVIEDQIARQILTWKPDLILIGKKAPGLLTLEQWEQIIQNANQKSGQPSAAFKQKIVRLGLRPWQATQVLQVDSHGVGYGSGINVARYVPELGVTAEDHAFVSRQLLSSKYSETPQETSFKPLSALSGSVGSIDDILRVVPVSIFGNARRSPSPQVGSMESLRILSKRQDHIRGLLNVNLNSKADLKFWEKQLAMMVAGLPRDSSGTLLYQLAMEYNEKGRSELATRTIRLFLNQNKNHPLSESAILWLYQHYASAEVRHQKSLSVDDELPVAASVVQQASAEIDASDFGIDAKMEMMLEQELATLDVELNEQPSKRTQSPIQKQRALVIDPRDLVQAKSETQSTDMIFGSQSDYVPQIDIDEANRLAQIIYRYQPTLSAHPRILFSNSALQTHDPNGDPQNAFSRVIKFAKQNGAYQDPARFESWLRSKSGSCPKAIATTTTSTSRPYLDGKLNEPVLAKGFSKWSRYRLF